MNEIHIPVKMLADLVDEYIHIVRRINESGDGTSERIAAEDCRLALLRVINDNEPSGCLSGIVGMSGDRFYLDLGFDGLMCCGVWLEPDQGKAKALHHKHDSALPEVKP